MLEEERKYGVDDGFELPDLAGAVPRGGRALPVPPVTLVATYFDTADLRLARAGVSLRHRKGDPSPWTVKLPAGTPGTRHEISRTGRLRTIPVELVELVTAYHRGAELAPVAVVRTVRHATELRDRKGGVLAEVVDDRVTVLGTDGAVTGTFRELEVERGTGDAALLDRVEVLLRAAGAELGEFVPKHVRALGSAAEGEPDLVAPGDLPETPTAGEVATEAIRDGVRRLLTHDPLVRLRAPVGEDDSAVHKMRVGCRRLRSDLRTFAPLLRPAWARPLRDELKWLAGVLGAARDAEVLRARLRRTAAADPICPVDQASVDRLDAVLTARQEAALAGVDEALRSARYVALVDALVLAARSPRLTGKARSDAGEVLPTLVSRPWRRLTGSGRGRVSAGSLDEFDPDERWHDVRKEGKQARYALDAVRPVVGGDARKLSRALARVQDLLGEHQDAAVAADTWIGIADEQPDDHPLAVTAGRLAERERASVRAVRLDFPAAWRQASRSRRTRWLP